MRAAAVAVLLALVATAMPGADDQPWPLSETQADTLYLHDGDPMFGTIEREDADGSIVFIADKGVRTTFAHGQVDHVEHRRTAAQIVAHNAALLIQRRDLLGLQRTLDFGFEHKADDAAMIALRAAIAALPGDPDLAGYAFKHVTDAAELEALARATLQRNQLYDPAYEVLIRILLDANRFDEVDQLARQWLSKHPTNESANRLMAASAEKRGDLRSAAECYRKGKDLHHNPDATLGYARCVLLLGDWTVARKAADELIATGQHLDEAAAIVGAALLAQGDAVTAERQLATAVAATLPDDLATIARYDLGLAQWRRGDAAAARATWQQVDTPVTALALAIVDRRPFDDTARLPARLKAVAEEHNACLALEHGDHARARTGLGSGSDKRHAFLRDVADVLARGGDEAAVRALEKTPGVESLRWQAYAHLIAGRFKDAETTLAKLPPDDGYAAIYRVYAASAQNDEPRARELFQEVAASSGAPTSYVARLAAEYAVADDARVVEDFDWKGGEVLGTGWQSAAIGTGVRIYAEDGKLVLAGMQSASADPVSRAWRLVPSARLRAAQVDIDIAGLSSATAGIELCDDQGKVGVQLAVRGDHTLAWRAIADAVAGPTWEKVALTGPAAALATLRLEYQNGRAFAVQPDDPLVRVPLGERLFKAEPEALRIGVFGVADAGVSWRAAVDQLELQLKPSAAK